ncbi:MAG TPA: right-handed parallel beta-helix repeat-containing protein [Rhodanobacteraceae bacterium]|nr:right-handed parallel beta-helix repeat-containing protein [Rhodanobacteraceae bacterium]
MLAAWALAALPAQAGGLPVCVSTNAQLANALATAEFVPTTIKIVQGNYDLRSTILHGGLFSVSLQDGSELLGGYTAGCAGRDIEVGNTVLGDTNPNNSDNEGANTTGDLTVEGLTWTVGVGFAAGVDGHSLPAHTMLLIRRDAFLNAHANLFLSWWNDDEDADGTIRVVDTLVAGNIGVACSLNVVAVYGSPVVQLVHDTIVDNIGSTGHGSGACVYNNGGDAGDGHATLSATNNIFYGNEQYDIDTGFGFGNPVVVTLNDNVIGPHRTPDAIELGTLSGNPQLDSDYRPIESPPSEVINTGSSTAPGGLPATDLPGRNRVIGIAPDRGAFESTINDAFLQTVTNTGDSGTGSLRAAIANANAHGSGLITFDIGSGCGPHVITLDSPLPQVTAPLIINGNTQTGASANDLEFGTDATFCVILEAGNASVTKALQIPTSAGDGAAMRVEGLAFSGFSDAAIALGSGDGSVIIGNRFGGTVGGHALAPNGLGIRLDVNSHDAIVGGDDVADRNIIGGATGSGMVLFGGLSSATHGNQVVNNLIGVDWTGDASGHFVDLGNGARGIYLAGDHNTISGNWIGDNAQTGIAVLNGGATHNTIDGNWIGFPWGSGLYGNGLAGIHVQGDAGDAPSINVITDNVIAENATQGVWVEIGQRNKIRRNGIYGNGGLGIDLDATGVLPNDVDADSEPPDYANRGQNYPELEAAIGGRASGWFTGLLDSTLGNYRIDFYQTPGGCPAGDNRQGQAWVGSIPVSITIGVVGGDGIAAIANHVEAADFFGGLVAGAGITATATDSDGNTSEFSACIPYQDDTIFANGFDP